MSWSFLAAESANITTPRVVGVLERRGQFFFVDGQPWTAIQSSDFSLFKRHLDGDVNGVAVVLTQRSSLGFNMLRVWLLNTSVIPGGLEPKHYSNFYTQLQTFAVLCGRYGLCVEFTVFTQTKTLMPSFDEQSTHLRKTADAVRGMGHVLLELVNENDQHDNACDPRLSKPGGVLCSHGSNGADAAPVRPAWDYELYHTNDLSEFQRKVGHNAMELADQTNKPCISNENTRFPDKDSNPNHAYDAAMGGALLCAGSCFHSNSGKLSTLFDTDKGPNGDQPSELELAEAWVAGAKSVPLEFRAGQYAHLSELETGNIIRAYERRLPDGRSHRIFIRA